ncbi:MAG: glycosyltransferase family 39 protein [Oscillospiraceae bacterium]|nr:glycosyltransferase family 39 protein [Oscillospiraceae bacterium]
MFKIKEKTSYVALAIIALLPFCLIFNDNIWFDESYTLALIQHSYPEIIEILKTDMHPPLYFLSLKLFCNTFGYSIISTKVFSILGYSATVFIGGIILKKHFDLQTSIVYAVAVTAIPMVFYFSVQQRSYSWCIFFVTICFLQAVIAIKEEKSKYFIFMAISGLFASYNHFFALLAVGIIFAYINIFVFIKKRTHLKNILLSDTIIIIGYSLWVIPLLNQAQDAADNFWLKGIEPLSVIVFAFSLVIIGIFLLIKGNRIFEVIFAAICVLCLQTIGLIGTVFIRPFYIARYSIVIVGISACLISFAYKSMGEIVKKIVIILLCLMCAVNLSLTFIFEYDYSINNFRSSFHNELSKKDVFLYFDSSFGIMSYYYPDNKHICTYKENWFSAFENLEFIEKNQIQNLVSKKQNNIWIVKNSLTKTPDYIKNLFTLKKSYSFKCDFNLYEVYSVVHK